MRSPPPIAHHSLRSLPAGDAGIRATLREMASIVRAWKLDPAMRRLASLITARCPGRDSVCEAATIQAWVKQNIRFVSDVAGVETLQTPELTVAQKIGDCDDQSILAATLLQTLGHPMRFVAVDMGRGYQHVYSETLIGNQWVPIETTEPAFNLGDKPEGIVREMPQPI